MVGGYYVWQNLEEKLIMILTLVILDGSVGEILWKFIDDKLLNVFII